MRLTTLLQLTLLMPSLALAGQVDLKDTRVTKRSMSRVVTALESYKRICGAYPDTESGLVPLEAGMTCGGRHHGALLKPISKDAWGRFFAYESNGTTFTLTSFGRDGKEGGEGPDADIVTR